MTSKRINNFGKINRNRVVSFTWDQKKYFGLEGDSLASAMLANNIKIIGRSFKYHRPRGIMSCGVEESGALVTIGEGEKRDPNVRATTQELYEGLVASGQNAFPNVNFDLAAVNGLLSPFFAAGFYYKTFMGLPPFEWGKGTKIWMLYENDFLQYKLGLMDVEIWEAKLNAMLAIYNACPFRDITDLVLGFSTAELSVLLSEASQIECT